MPIVLSFETPLPPHAEVWEEKCTGCKTSYPVTAQTRWNQCSRCEGQFCHRCVTTDGQCFACAIETHPHQYPCDNCRQITPESDLGDFHEFGEEQRLQVLALEAAGEWDEARRRGPISVCLKCYRSLESARIARRSAELKQRADGLALAELRSLVQMYGAAVFEKVNAEAGLDYSAMHRERFGTEVR